MKKQYFNNLVNELLKVSLIIKNGTKGKDYLVIENGDEMNGYEKTEIETHIMNISKEIIDIIDNNPKGLNPDNLTKIFLSILNSKDAIDAYRSRMWKYATDWGSEISPIANITWNLIFCLKTAYKKLIQDNIDLLKNIEHEILNQKLTLYYYSEWDNHSTLMKSIFELMNSE